MKYLILIFSMLSISALKAEVTPTVQETASAPSVSAQAIAVEIKPELAAQTELAGEKAAEVLLEEELLPIKNLTATEKLKVYRTKLEEKNLILLEKKLEMIRLQQEMALIRNLEKSMDQALKNIENL